MIYDFYWQITLWENGCHMVFSCMAGYVSVPVFSIMPCRVHWKKYFNVHFKSQNYSCLLDSHPCLGYRNFCCKKISCNKSKIKAVVLMEKLKQHNLGVKSTPAYFFPCHFDSENKLHWQYSLSIRQYSLSIRQRILLM